MQQAAATKIMQDYPLDGSSHSANHAPDFDASYTIGHVESQLHIALRELRGVCAQMRRVESELQYFLYEYAEQVGVFGEQLAQLRAEIQEYDAKLAAAPVRRLLPEKKDEENALLAVLQEALPQLPARLDSQEWQQEMEAVYHRLVATCRPLNHDNTRYSDKVNRLLAQAYGKANLWGMLSLEHTLVEAMAARHDTPERKLLRLRERLDAVAESTQRVSRYTETLEQMPAMRMKRNAERDALIFEKCIHQVQRQIQAAKALLARRKVEFRAAQALAA